MSVRCCAESRVRWHAAMGYLGSPHEEAVAEGKDGERRTGYFGGGASTQAYGVYWPHKGYANRSYFLIDVHGVVRWSHVEEHPGHKRDNAELLARVTDL